MRWVFPVLLVLLPVSLSWASDSVIDARGAKSICSEVVHGMTARDLKSKQVTFSKPSPSLQKRLLDLGWDDPNGNFAQIDDHGRHEIYDYHLVGGSCSTYDIVRVRALKKDESATDAEDLEPQEDSDNPDLRWAGWGASSTLLKIHGAVVVLEGTTAVYAYHDDERVPLCTLEAPTSITVLRSGSGGICAAAQKHAIRKVAGSLINSDATELGKWGVRSDKAESITVTNGQIPLHLGRFHFDSGAGCGASLEYLAELDANNRVVNSPLTATLLGIRTPNDTQGNQAIFFASQTVMTLNGHVLIARKSLATEIDQLNGNHLDKICELEDVPQPQIKEVLIQQPAKK